MNIHLEAAREDDPFLFELYAHARAEEVAAWGWTMEQQSAFLAMQFQFQQQSYRMQYPDHQIQIIVADGQQAGKWHTALNGKERILVDASILPSYRNRGIGTTLIRMLQEEARSAGLSLHLSVRIGNPARRLYERLGFRAVKEDELQAHMRWTIQEHLKPQLDLK